MNDELNADAPLVLLVEDNPDDVVLVRRALRKAGLAVRLHVLDDGEQAADFFDAWVAADAAGATGTLGVAATPTQAAGGTPRGAAEQAAVGHGAVGHAAPGQAAARHAAAGQAAAGQAAARQAAAGQHDPDANTSAADSAGAAAAHPALRAGPTAFPAEPPALVLLDWKLPLRSGEEVLRGLRGQPVLHGLPVIVLTTSDEREDVERAYRAGATSYLRKPVDFHALIRLLDTVHLYWLRTNVPPPLGRP